VTALVGPNGSGKSNVVDALRWVFGEQNPRLLRGVRWEEVIFAGSPGRRPLGLAEVSVTLDNSTGSLDIPYREVEISRRLLRSGESEYSINRVPCRLKDILDLTAGTGAAGAAYAYVPQAAVDEILKSRPEDRREVIEEAAGLAKYRGRRQEAQRRLSEVDVARERLQDLLCELDGQIQPLLAESEASARFVAIRSELEDLNCKLWADATARLERRRASGAERLAALNADNESLAGSHDELRHAIEAARSELVDLRQHCARVDQQVASLADEVQRRAGQQAVLQERLSHLERESQSATARVATARQRRTTVAAELELLFLPEAAATEGGLTPPADVCAAAKSDSDPPAAPDRLPALSPRDQLERGIAAATDVLDERETHLAQTRRREREVRDALEETRAAYAVVGDKAVAARAGLESLTHRLQHLQRRCAELDCEVGALAEQARTHAGSVAEAQDRLTASRALVASLRHELESAATQLLEAREAATQTRARLQVAGERLASATAARGTLPLAAAAAQTARSLGKEVELTTTPLADLILVEPGYEKAVGTALGLAQHALVARDWASLLRTVEARQARALRGTVALLAREGGERGQAPDLGGVRSLAAVASTRDSDALPQAVLDDLLASYGVVDDFAQALAAGPNRGGRVGIVSRDGRAVLPSGLVLDGVDGQEPTAIELARAEQQLAKALRDLKAEAEAASAAEAEALGRHGQLSEDHRRAVLDHVAAEKSWQTATAGNEAAAAAVMQMSARLDAAAAEAAALEEQIEPVRVAGKAAAQDAERLREELGRRAESAAALRQELESAERAVSEARAAVHDLTLKLARMDQAQQARQERLERLRTEAAALADEVTTATLTAEAAVSQVTEIRHKLEAAESELAGLRAEHADARQQARDIAAQVAETETALRNRNAELAQVQRARNDLNEQIHRQELLLERLTGEQLSLEVERKSLAPRHLAAATPQQISDGPALRARRDELEAALADMGTVNPGAADQVRRLQARHAFLSRQEQDLAESAQSLAASAVELEREIEARFLACFAETRSSFARVFTNLFGGGQADLELTDPESPLTSGVEILAQPPGKRMTSLALLSGGERALTAIALLFAMLTRQAAGFSVLDEVDAHLDEPNCLRFRRYLRSLASERQFLVVTHNKATMEAADLLYGLTMEEDGISRVISARLTQQRTVRSEGVD